MKNLKIKILLAIIIILMIIVFLFIFMGNKQNNTSHKITNGELASSNEQINNLKDVKIVGMRNLVVQANTKNVNVNFVNPIDNEGLYYQAFELRLLNDTQEGYEVLYKSDLINPGTEINEITLAKELDKGEYDAIFYVQSYHMDEAKTPTNDAKIKVKIIAQ